MPAGYEPVNVGAGEARRGFQIPGVGGGAVVNCGCCKWSLGSQQGPYVLLTAEPFHN